MPTLAGLPFMKTSALTPIATTVTTRPLAVALTVALMGGMGAVVDGDDVGLADGVTEGDAVGLGDVVAVGFGVGVGVGVRTDFALTVMVV